jgi:NAD(P)H-hydrate repair Nnr-like enzyme with NAD(P)H-hydrate dehydratase domain
VSAATVAGPGTAAAAAAAERQQRVTTAADPKAVIQGTPLKNAKLANHYDAIVIGSGIGGLATAVALSKYAGVNIS